MKKIFFAIFALGCYLLPYAQPKHLKNGFYIIAKITPDSLYHTGKNEALVSFDKDFLETAPDSGKYLVLNSGDFVPLELESAPELLQQPEGRKMLQMTFSKPAAGKLEKLTGANMMREAALVVNGKALTVNKIRDKITNGKLQITRSSDNACEMLYLTLQKNVKTKK